MPMQPSCEQPVGSSALPRRGFLLSLLSGTAAAACQPGRIAPDHRRTGVPFQIRLSGTLNGAAVRIGGEGAVTKRGHYEADLDFDRIPSGIHPSAIATYTISICCIARGDTMNGAMNIMDMGATGYSTVRTLRFDDGRRGTVTIEGDINIGRGSIGFNGQISGEAELPGDLSGLSIYFKRIEPHDNGSLLRGVGQGSLSREERPNVPVLVHTAHTLRPAPVPRPLTQREFRIVTEAGTLRGMRYSTQVSSFLDGRNTLSAVEQMPFPDR